MKMAGENMSFLNSVDDLLDYDEETNANIIQQQPNEYDQGRNKVSYAGIDSTSFRDFLLKPELMRGITDCGFEHPSEVQQESIPQAILGLDILCQAKSGTGKTAIFVLASLQQIEPVDGIISAIVLCNTRELAIQVKSEYTRFGKYMPTIRTQAVYGGVSKANDVDILSQKSKCPHIIVGTPGRVLELIRDKSLNLSYLKHFVLDECDTMLESLDMRRDVQKIFQASPRNKQVMMFSATLATEMRSLCKRFLRTPLEIYVDDEPKLTLHGLQQFYINTQEGEKNKTLNDLLDTLCFNQACIFVRSVSRANELSRILNECKFPSICIHSQLTQDERIKRYALFKNLEKRIMVATDMFGRGIDIERVNVVINYDLPKNADLYLHQVGRAGCFGMCGMAITFITDQDDDQVFGDIQDRFEVDIKPYTDRSDFSISN